MPQRKKYYPKKKYYRKRKYYSNNNQEIDPIAWLIVLIIIFSYMTYTLFIKPNLENIILFLQIFISTIIIIAWVLYYYFNQKKKTIEQDRISKIPDFLLKLEKDIKSYKPYKKFDKEEPYQIWLHWHLQHEYPELEVEKTIDYTRPDIIINDIAIEIKWPTKMSWLSTLPDKINKYLPKRDYLFIVLFDINIVENKTKEENLMIYEEKKKEILENTIESKRDKIFFIEI